MAREEDIEHGEPLCMERFDIKSTRDMHIRSITRQERPLLQFEYLLEEPEGTAQKEGLTEGASRET